MTLWSAPYPLLREEFRQRRDEGVVVPESMSERFRLLDPVNDAWNETDVWDIFEQLAVLPIDPQLTADEPNEFAAIRAARPDGPRDLHWHPTEPELVDRLHGAWTGRATGCALGKPVELLAMGVHDDRLTGRHDIKAYLQRRNDWPLTDYFSGRAMGDGFHDEANLWCPASTREQIAYMEPDDDIHYTLVALGVLEAHGPDFAWLDVAEYWMRHLPMGDVCTAEAQALLNWMQRTARVGAPGVARSIATPEFCRTHHNPYREWIGAQIRADGWGWMCAGRPELAAEFAYRDACWTHERNGIYGAMFFAAVHASAFCVCDPHELIGIGLSEIPRNSRLARVVQRTVAICARAATWEAAMDEIEVYCNSLSPPVMSPVHTLNNAAVCVMAMLFGEMDSVQAVTTAVMAGLDTDCNGATVGSIVGAAAGRANMRPDLADRLHDTIRPNLIGFQQVTMHELARRTADQWHRIRHGSPVAGRLRGT